MSAGAEESDVIKKRSASLTQKSSGDHFLGGITQKLYPLETERLHLKMAAKLVLCNSLPLALVLVTGKLPDCRDNGEKLRLGTWGRVSIP